MQPANDTPPHAGPRRYETRRHRQRTLYWRIALPALLALPAAALLDLYQPVALAVIIVLLLVLIGLLRELVDRLGFLGSLHHEEAASLHRLVQLLQRSPPD